MAKEVKAQAKNVRGSAQKARIVADAVRGKNAIYALDVLKYMRKGAAHDVRKVVQSAVSNAEHNEAMNPEDLVISKIFVDEGITYKRFRPESKGRVRRIMKRNCHITVYVTDNKDVKAGLKVESEKNQPRADKEEKKAETKEEKTEKKTDNKAKTTKTDTKKATKKTSSKPKSAKKLATKAKTKSESKK